MSTPGYEAVVLGASLDGLTAAAYLAKAGLRVLVLEPRDVAGNAAVTEEMAPGFQVDVGLHDAGWVPAEIIEDLALSRHGLHLLRPDPPLVALLPDGGELTLWRDPARTREVLQQHSPADAGRWIPFSTQIHRFARFLETVYRAPPPRPVGPSRRDGLDLLSLGWRLRRLGKREMVEFMRTFPMAVTDFLDDWFDDPGLKGLLGTSGIHDVFQGPRSGGTAFVLLHNAVGAELGLLRPRGLVRGGVGTLTASLIAAARAAGADIHFGAEAVQVVVQHGHAAGVALKSGDVIAARRVVSSVDPRRTFLELVDPTLLPPEFTRAVRCIRFRGAWAKVNLALSEIPRFVGFDNAEERLRGIMCISPNLDYLERAYDDAKYGKVSQNPYLEIMIPSLTAPNMAPPGTHVMSVVVRYAPYRLRNGEWDDAAGERLGDLVVQTIAQYAPNFPAAILHQQVLTPRDLERRFGLPEGSANHGELALDQILFMRPIAGWDRYDSPIPGLYLCGPGTHPGGGIVGGSGRNAARQIVKDKKAS